jgi:hypothetical protein
MSHIDDMPAFGSAGRMHHIDQAPVYAEGVWSVWSLARDGRFTGPLLA